MSAVARPCSDDRKFHLSSLEASQSCSVALIAWVIFFFHCLDALADFPCNILQGFKNYTNHTNVDECWLWMLSLLILLFEQLNLLNSTTQPLRAVNYLLYALCGSITCIIHWLLVKVLCPFCSAVKWSLQFLQEGLYYSASDQICHTVMWQCDTANQQFRVSSIIELPHAFGINSASFRWIRSLQALNRWRIHRYHIWFRCGTQHDSIKCGHLWVSHINV